MKTVKCLMPSLMRSTAVETGIVSESNCVSPSSSPSSLLFYSHLMNVPPGPHNLSDMILSTIMADENAPAAAVSMSSGGGDMGGIDPNMDPELAMVSRRDRDGDGDDVSDGNVCYCIGYPYVPRRGKTTARTRECQQKQHRSPSCPCRRW